MERSVAKRQPPREAALGWAGRKDEILDVAARLFATHGYADTDTQLVAEELNVGKGTLYRYFPSKEKLFLAATDRVMTQLRCQIDAAIARIDDPFDRIIKAIHTFLGFFAENTGRIEILMQERAYFKDRKKPTYFEHREANCERWRSLYRGLISAGRVRKVPIDRIMDVISDLCYGTIFTNYFAGRRKPLARQVRDIADIFFHGILTVAERRRRRTA